MPKSQNPKLKPESWLLFVYKVPSEPARKRTFVWRKLNRMHALYLQQAVCLLPNTEENATELENLAVRVRDFDGEATLLRVQPQNETWEREIRARFESERNAKYEKLQEEIRKFVDEIEFEEHRKRFTVEELEELEEKLDALVRWSEKLSQEEPTSSRGDAKTRAELKAAAVRLDLFAAKVESFAEKREPLRHGTARGKRRLS